MYRIVFFVLILVVVLSSCQNKEKQHNDEYTQPIRERLLSLKGKGILFGHQDDMAYGIDWKYVDGNSDVKGVSGSYPAVFGWELGGLELGHATNLDSVPFDAIRKFAIRVNEMGGINTFSWHSFSPITQTDSWNTDTVVVPRILPGGNHHDVFVSYLDKVAEFLKSLKTPNGEQVPFIFRPWHEMDGSWFWWGDEHCTAEEYKTLFRFTIDYLRNEKGLKNMTTAYSVDYVYYNKDEFMKWYPGDEYVDIMGLDDYYDFRSEGGGVEAVILKLYILIDAAKEHAKIAAFTETGLENMSDSTWFTEKLGAVLNDSLIRNEISYVMTWRNDPDVHFFFSYPGHSSEVNARQFLDDPNILLLNDIKNK